jgi:hypothetical protein
MKEKIYKHNRVSINLEKYLNPIIDEANIEGLEFNYLPKWFKLPKIFRRKEKSLEDKL